MAENDSRPRSQSRNERRREEMTEKRLGERREVFYSGQVQGVGFRYRSASIAARYRVVGFVRNLEDGRVQLVAEGAASELDKFLADIAESMRSCIRDMRLNVGPATGEFDEFSIRA